MRLRLMVGIGLTSAACAAPPSHSMNDLILLTRDQCVQTDTLRAHLDTALKAMKQPATYQILDLATLKADDPRSGYPTPTLLRGGRDLFGMTAPTPPFPEPT